MQTKLSRFCDGILEAGWLLAVILVPVFFNIYSSRIFEPDKITLLRSIALILLLVWIIKLSEDTCGTLNMLNIKERLYKTLQTPFVIPVLVFALVYIIATVFSVAPATSLWGSYQRLQGTYTTFSYLIVFGAIVGNLRKRSQLERLITAMIVASLPVSLYGVLQRYQIDPIPWGGDVSYRIASNMGNSIFVAAYLIMVSPLTIGRIFSSFRAILSEADFVISDFARATGYVFIGALNVIAIYFTGSRGPTLGWLVGCFVLALMLALIWQRRSIVFITVGIAIILGGFLLVLNIEGGPLDGLRNTSAIGRFGQLLDPQSNNARVRTYIWKGAAKLVIPHTPLQYPDGAVDKFNWMRPLIGYGPESMYVAYNPFYPPELTQVEKRNASPDRAHNETWDALVITGVAGFFAYLIIFSSIIYLSLKWMGLISTKAHKMLFLGLLYGLGCAIGIGIIFWRGYEYFGVGLPFGMVVGIIVYFTYISIWGGYNPPENDLARYKALWIAVFLAAILAHFVEINFGIAIVSTRTYFWIYSGLLLLMGHFQIIGAVNDENSEVIQITKDIMDVKVKTRKKRHSPRFENPIYLNETMTWLLRLFPASFILAVILVTLGYEFISIAQGGDNPLGVIWNSLTRLKNIYSGISYGVIAMLITSWVVGGIIIISEELAERSYKIWLKNIFVVIGCSGFLASGYWLTQANSLLSLNTFQVSTIKDVLFQVSQYELLLVKYYLYLALLLVAGAFAIVGLSIIKSTKPIACWKSALLVVLILIGLPILILGTNIKIIQADIAFKLAEPFNKQDTWPVAIEIYQHAIDLAPSEDYYYLFLGRAYLEYAKTLENPEERDGLIGRAEKDLISAQTINPLNTDHTANLARLYSLWSAYTDNETISKQRAQISADYFSKATTLSPNNARLWDEWALLYLSNLEMPEMAEELLAHSVTIDPFYDWTHALLGEYYSKQAQGINDQEQKVSVLEQAIYHFNEAQNLTEDVNTRVNYLLAEAQTAINAKAYDVAIDSLQKVLQLTPSHPDLWRYNLTLAQLYFQIGDYDTASIYANSASMLAPEGQEHIIESLLTQIQSNQ